MNLTYRENKQKLSPGAKLITDQAGKDATAVFDPIHPKDIMEKLLKPQLRMGAVNPASIREEDIARPPERKSRASIRRGRRSAAALWRV